MRFRPNRRSHRFLSLALGVVAGIGAMGQAPAAAVRDGVAIGIVFDTSGSMRDPVDDAAQGRSPKHVVGRRALMSVVDRLEAFVTGPGAAGRRVEADLVVFQNARPEEVVAFGSFDAKRFRDWTEGFRQPEGATPLGNAIELAARRTLTSDLPRKHVLVITDGVNTAGPKPEFVLPGLQQTARDQDQVLAVHFVAFDVAAKEFQPVRDLGATVLEAGNEAELNARLNFIIERKILLEDEE